MHRVEYRRQLAYGARGAGHHAHAGRRAVPRVAERFALVTGRPDAGGASHGERMNWRAAVNRLRALIEFALGEGWRVVRPAGT